MKKYIAFLTVVVCLTCTIIIAFIKYYETTVRRGEIVEANICDCFWEEEIRIEKFNQLNSLLAKHYPEYEIYATMAGGTLTLTILFDYHIPELTKEEKNRLWDLATNFLRKQTEN